MFSCSTCWEPWEPLGGGRPSPRPPVPGQGAEPGGSRAHTAGPGHLGRVLPLLAVSTQETSKEPQPESRQPHCGCTAGLDQRCTAGPSVDAICPSGLQTGSPGPPEAPISVTAQSERRSLLSHTGLTQKPEPTPQRASDKMTPSPVSLPQGWHLPSRGCCLRRSPLTCEGKHRLSHKTGFQSLLKIKE